EHFRSGGVIGWLGEGNVVAPLTLAPVRRVQAKWRARNDREIETRPELVVVAEPITKADSKDLVVLGRVLVSVSEVGHARVRREPTLIGHQRQPLSRNVERIRRWLLAR